MKVAASAGSLEKVRARGQAGTALSVRYRGDKGRMWDSSGDSGGAARPGSRIACLSIRGEMRQRGRQRTGGRLGKRSAWRSRRSQVRVRTRVDGLAGRCNPGLRCWRVL